MNYPNKLRIGFAVKEALVQGFFAAALIAAITGYTTLTMGVERLVLVSFAWLISYVAGACVILAINLEWLAPKRHERLVTAAITAGVILILAGIWIPQTQALKHICQALGA